MQRGGFIARTKCPKCGGSVYLDSDHYGWYEECLQCGYTRDMNKLTQVDIETGDKYILRSKKEPIEI